MRETPTLEFKSSLTKTYLKTVSAFANYGTGRVVFGVDDDGTPVGLDDLRGAALSIENAINDSLSPVPRFELSVDEADRTVSLTVYEGPAKPYLCNGKAYRRADSATVEVDRLEYNRLSLVGANVTFDELESARQDLTFACLGQELSRTAGIEPLDDRALISLQLMSPSRRYYNAAALLADENQFLGTDVARFGEDTNVILSRHVFERISVLTQMERVLAVFDEHYTYEQIDGMKRVEKSLIPREAFREALANALVHRRWDIQTNVRVSMFADRIEIMSPGGLPDGMTEELYLSGGPSVARNPILANVLYRLGYIERFGTGIPRIMAAYEGLMVSPRFAVGESSIAVTLPVEQGIALSAEEKSVLAVMPKGFVQSRAEIEAAAGLSKDKALRILAKLVDKGLARREGSGRSVRYVRG